MWVAGGVAIVALLTALFVFARKLRPWLTLIALAAATLALVFVIEFVLPARYPNVDPSLPLFYNHIWTWMLAFSVIALFGAVHACRMLLVPTTAAAALSESAVGLDPEIQASLDTIEIRLAQAQINLAKSPVFLLLAPDEEDAAQIVRAAGLQLYTQAPETTAPIHAYASADMILLSCAGASSFGTQVAQGDGGLEALCRALLSKQPECPIVRGVVVALPAEWASQPESPKLAAAVRDDLRTIQRVFRLRLPVFAFLPRMETIAGFTEFVRRMPEAMRQSRSGFAIPSTETFSADLIQRGLAWLSGWFNTWVLSQMSEDLMNQAGNNALFCLDHEVRRRRKAWRNVLDSAFSTHRDAEPLLFRGLYLIGTGHVPNEQAFAAGLLRGARGRVIADRFLAEWSAEAIAHDRRYRALALGIGLAGGMLALFAWFYIVQQSPLWWLGLLALVAVWVGVFARRYWA
jgi:IcmF-related N-terminal domain